MRRVSVAQGVNELSFSNYKSVGVNDPQCIVNLDPWDMVGRIYVGDH